ncbi:MAG: thioredoxin family protein [Anaerolineales bacterium]|nr:thioredoxin family protein [Anaerolineales bacterium]
MDKNTFQRGESLETFVQSMEALIREKFNLLLEESRVALAETKGLSPMRSDLRVVVIAEPWSGDVLFNLPALLALAETLDWQVRIFKRDEHLHIIEPYKKEGIYLSIPVFIFYDKDFKEIADWVERPQIATKTIDEESLNLRRRLREEKKVEWRHATLMELNNLLAK